MRQLLRYSLILLVITSVLTVQYYHTLTTNTATANVVVRPSTKKDLVSPLHSPSSSPSSFIAEKGLQYHNASSTEAATSNRESSSRKGPRVNKNNNKVPSRKGGRDGADDSHKGLVRDPLDGMLHAWEVDAPTRCFGAAPRPECVDPTSIEWFREHVLLAIVSGAEGAFRVEVSSCSWLAHFPIENVFVFSDLVPIDGQTNRTAHTWVKGVLPVGVTEKDGDLVSVHVPNGYVQEVRKRGQGYSASWIVAQFRFTQAVEHLYQVALSREKTLNRKLPYDWFLVIDDDTILQLPNLVKRLQQVKVHEPFYLSRKGWGGAGHAYTRRAMEQLIAVLPVCVDKYFIRSFRASDDMLLRCAYKAKLHCQKEASMSHCPASHVGVEYLLSPSQVSVHGKKDFYPPVQLTTWRVSLYYYAFYCRWRSAAEAAVYYSACAFGSCKQSGCTKEKNAQVLNKWARLSENNTVSILPFEKVIKEWKPPLLA